MQVNKTCIKQAVFTDYFQSDVLQNRFPAGKNLNSIVPVINEGISTYFELCA